MSNEDQENISWNNALETLIANEAERCSELSLLHKECEAYFSFRTNIITLPVIVLSTVNGFLSGSSKIILSETTSFSIGIGAISLFTGFLSTIGSYFAWAKRTEAHRISAIQFRKISRDLTIQLSLLKNERVNARDILKLTREQIAHLLEISPEPIPDVIQKKYEEKFKDVKDVSHPELISGLNKVYINTETVKNGMVKILVDETSRG
jgi:hypothetical protein